jgi:hypothetical protein
MPFPGVDDVIWRLGRVPSADDAGEPPVAAGTPAGERLDPLGGAKRRHLDDCWRN